jgi:hypothetical protein
MPTIVDVNEIHTPGYEPMTMKVEEEQNPTHEAGKLEEDAKRTKSDTSRGKGTQH